MHDLLSVQYSVDESDLLSRTLWLSVWDWDRFGRNQFLGEVRLPLKSLDLQSDTELWYTLLDKVLLCRHTNNFQLQMYVCEC